MYEWARPGVKVVCVIDSDMHDLLKEGSVYEIREVRVVPNQRYYLGKMYSECVTLKLVGFKDRYEFGTGNFVVGFNIKRFRPLVPKGLPDTLTILLEKPNRLIVPDGGRWDVRKQKEKTRQ